MTLKERLRKFDLLPEAGDVKENSVSPELKLLYSNLSKDLSAKISAIPVWFEYTKDEQKKLILNFLNAKLSEEFSEITLTEAEKDRICALFLKSVYGFGPLDFLIGQSGVKTIIVDSSDSIYIELNDEIVKADVVLDKKQFEVICDRFSDLSKKKAPVVSFRFNDLFVTILSEPVCSKKIILKKISKVNFDFDYFESRQIINADIAAFIKSSLKAGKRFLISAPQGNGKTKLVNAFVNETAGECDYPILFESGEFINSDINELMRYNIEGLVSFEQKQLIKAVMTYKPGIVFSDVNDIAFNIEVVDNLKEGVGFAACVSAESVQDAFDFYTRIQTSLFKCSENYARIKFSKYFDYIIQLEKTEDDFVIKSIFEVVDNSGSPVLSERLSFNSGEYKYDFPAIEVVMPPRDADPVSEPVQQKRLSFKARFEKS